MLISEAWERYQSDKRIEGYSPLTLKMYGFQCELLKRYFGNIMMDELTTENLKQYLGEAGRHLKSSSLGHRVRFIKSLFEFFYSTGCRIGEVARLNQDDINFEENSVIVRGKGDKEREVYFNIRCGIWLRRYIEERDDNEPCLFVTERKPRRRMSIDTLRYIVKRISNRAGIKKTIHPHQLRHSYATHMVDNGAPLEVIQSLLGHENEKSETTKIYAHLSGKLRHDFYSKYF